MQGGWSSDDLLDRGAHIAAVSRLELALLRQAQRLLTLDLGTDTDTRVLLMLWATVLPQGAQLTPHRHVGASGAHYSGIYFLDAGDTADSMDGYVHYISAVALELHGTNASWTGISFSGPHLFLLRFASPTL